MVPARFPKQSGKATRIRLLDFKSPEMRAFHMSWLAFFLCFFAWFGIAPLMKIVRDEMSLTKTQIGWTIIGSVSITIVARLLIGWLCDRIGPRLTYAALLVFGSLPVMGIGLARDFESFLLCRILIGAIGAAFVITQYHTSVMFAPNCVGTANATTAGWGNLGGGVTQLAMPLVLAFFVGAVGLSDEAGWRAAMFVAGSACMLTGVAYFCLTQDAPGGNFRELRALGVMPAAPGIRGSFRDAMGDRRVWALFGIYAACFGVELTINNIASLYFLDYFDEFRRMEATEALTKAGLFAGLFGLMNVFARTLGGMFSDRVGQRWGLQARVHWLFVALLCEGLSLILFSQTTTLGTAVPALILFSLFVQMSEGATYAVVPFINPRALGAVAGLVGAGGNVGAVAAGFLFQGGVPWPAALTVIGLAVTAAAFLAFAVRFSPDSEAEAAVEVQNALDVRHTLELAGSRSR